MTAVLCYAVTDAGRGSLNTDEIMRPASGASERECALVAQNSCSTGLMPPRDTLLYTASHSVHAHSVATANAAAAELSSCVVATSTSQLAASPLSEHQSAYTQALEVFESLICYHAAAPNNHPSTDTDKEATCSSYEDAGGTRCGTQRSQFIGEEQCFAIAPVASHSDTSTEVCVRPTETAEPTAEKLDHSGSSTNHILVTIGSHVFESHQQQQSCLPHTDVSVRESMGLPDFKPSLLHEEDYRRINTASELLPLSMHAALAALPSDGVSTSTTSSADAECSRVLGSDETKQGASSVCIDVGAPARRHQWSRLWDPLGAAGGASGFYHASAEVQGASSQLYGSEVMPHSSVLSSCRSRSSVQHATFEAGKNTSCTTAKSAAPAAQAAAAAAAPTNMQTIATDGRNNIHGNSGSNAPAAHPQRPSMQPPCVPKAPSTPSNRATSLSSTPLAPPPMLAPIKTKTSFISYADSGMSGPSLNAERCLQGPVLAATSVGLFSPATSCVNPAPQHSCMSGRSSLPFPAAVPSTSNIESNSNSNSNSNSSISDRVGPAPDESKFISATLMHDGHGVSVMNRRIEEPLSSMASKESSVATGVSTQSPSSYESPITQSSHACPATEQAIAPPVLTARGAESSTALGGPHSVARVQGGRASTGVDGSFACSAQQRDDCKKEAAAAQQQASDVVSKLSQVQLSL